MSFLRCLLILSTAGLFLACDRDTPALAPQLQPDTGDADADGSVWIADSPDTGGRLFLCGTIHILREKDYPLPPAYEAAYRKSDKLIFELPPGSGANSALVVRMAELGTYSADNSLEASAGPDLWEKVKAWAAKRKIDKAAINQMRPWFAALIITATEYAALGAKPEIGVDQHFEQRAAKDGKPSEGLETVEFQLQLFSGLTDEQQRQMLEQTLEEIATLPDEYEKMIAAWKHGELDILGDMLFREAERFPELMDLFLIGRNNTWISRLDHMLRKGEKAMILVGAGHLAADSGLIQLLKDRGFRVRHYRDVNDL